MSVFGGDSWGREAQQRKRRVDDLSIEGLDGSSYRKLSNGKLACLVCPNRPVLDSPFMLAMHRKGSRHRAAESRLKDRELTRRDEINKRIALAGDSSVSASGGRISGKPLLEQTRRAASEVLSRRQSTDQETNPSANVSPPAKEPNLEVAPQQHLLDFGERRERELKFTSAGWKRDGHGKWYKDENVEFDSDEEDPNVCLA